MTITRNSIGLCSFFSPTNWLSKSGLLLGLICASLWSGGSPCCWGQVTDGSLPPKLDVSSPGQSAAAPQQIAYDADQSEPVFRIDRQQLVKMSPTFLPVFELFADGKLTDRRGSRTEKTIQLSPEDVQSVLSLAIVQADFFNLDEKQLQKQISSAKVGRSRFRDQDHLLTKIRLDTRAGKKAISIRGYSVARLQLQHLETFQRLTKVESRCEYLMARSVVGDREQDILAAINAEIKKRKLNLNQVKPADLRAAYEFTGGRFQVSYNAVQATGEPTGDAQTRAKIDDGAENDSYNQAVRITYFVTAAGQPPKISFFGNVGNSQ